MGAGLIMSMAKKVFSLYAKKEDSPRQVLTQVNDALADDLDGKRFITLTYAILDPAHRRITWCRAGHNPTLAYNLHTEELNEIKPPGMVLGMKQGSVFCESLLEEVTELRSGDVFLLFTDGVTEAMNRQGEEYGMERLREVLTNHAVHAPHDPGHMLDRVLDSVRHFRGGTDNLDDMALLALTVD
ncbi:MAG: PP2C family protein-serine/threonine phosphatase [Planctomycetota bacterium]